MQQLAKTTLANGGEPIAEALFLECGDILVNHTRGYAFRRKEKLDLTQPEFDVLSALLLKKGQAAGYYDLCCAVTGSYPHQNYDANKKFIDDLISCLRKKIGEPDIIRSFPAGYGMGIGGGLLKYGDITVDLFRKEVRRRDEIIDLKRKKFKMLAHMILHAGRIVSRRELVQAMADRKFLNPDYVVGSNIVDVHMSYLRRKLGESPS